jgi:hypothetical protein
MEIKVKVPDEVAAQAHACGVKVEAYVEEILARQAGGQTPPPLRTPKKFVLGWIRSHSSPIKSCHFPRTSPANGFTRNTLNGFRKLLILKAKGVTESNRNRLGVRRFYAKVSDWQHLRQLPTPLGIRRVYATSQGPMPPIP